MYHFRLQSQQFFFYSPILYCMGTVTEESLALAVSSSSFVKPSTAAQDFFNSLMRKDAKKGLTTEFRNRVTVDDSLTMKNQFCFAQLSQWIPTTMTAKYGISERIRNTKMRNDVVAILFSILAALSRFLSFKEVFLGMVACL